MNLHEYQTKERFRKYEIPVVLGKIATTPQEAYDLAAELTGRVVVKAQVLAGGRGKAGGVKLAKVDGSSKPGLESRFSASCAPAGITVSKNTKPRHSINIACRLLLIDSPRFPCAVLEYILGENIKLHHSA